MNASVDINAEKGRTPLYVASWKGHHPVVEALLKKGADPNKANLDGVTPIQAATENNHMDIVDILEKRKVIHKEHIRNS